MGLRWFCFNKLFNWLVNSCHPFDQSHAKLSPVWSHAFSRRFTCFYFELSLAPCNITLVVIGCCDEYACSGNIR